MFIFLVGMPGVGKSFWLKKLKAYYNCQGIDLDLFIEIANQKRISELFEQGEDYFRALEAKALRNIVSKFNNEKYYVISTGGGTACFHENMNYMNEHGLTIYLKADATFIKSRLEQSKVDRPLILNVPQEQRSDFIKELLQKRAPFYEQSQLWVDALQLRMPNFADLLQEHKIYR